MVFKSRINGRELRLDGWSYGPSKMSKMCREYSQEISESDVNSLNNFNQQITHNMALNSDTALIGVSVFYFHATVFSLAVVHCAQRRVAR